MKPFLPALAFIRKKQKPFSPNKNRRQVSPGGVLLGGVFMRLPEPKKLPSGNWRIQVLVDGKRVGRTFPTKEEAEYWAAGLKTKIMEGNRSP